MIDPILFPKAGPHQSGDQCPRCKGYLGIYCTRMRYWHRVRFLRCTSCKWLPANNQWVVPFKDLAEWQRAKHSYQNSQHAIDDLGSE